MSSPFLSCIFELTACIYCTCFALTSFCFFSSSSFPFFLLLFFRFLSFLSLSVSRSSICASYLRKWLISDIFFSLIVTNHCQIVVFVSINPRFNQHKETFFPLQIQLYCTERKPSAFMQLAWGVSVISVFKTKNDLYHLHCVGKPVFALWYIWHFKLLLNVK